MKKGNVAAETAIIIVLIFIFAIGLVFVNNFMQDFNTEIQDDSDLSDEMKSYIDVTSERFPIWTDSAFVMVFILAWIAVIAFSFFIDSHPVFFGISVIVLVMIVALAMMFSNIYAESVTEDTELSVAGYPKMDFIMNNLLEFMIAIGLSVTISLFLKTRFGA